MQFSCKQPMLEVRGARRDERCKTLAMMRSYFKWKKTSYMRLMIFLDIFTIVPITIFSHNLLVLLPSKLVFLLFVKSSFLVTKSKKQNILVKLQNCTCPMMQIPYLYYILKFSSSLFSSLVPIFQISFFDLGTLWIIKNKGWNKDMGWDMVWDWGGLCGYLYQFIVNSPIWVPFLLSLLPIAHEIHVKEC